jgi:cytochrome c peroxidase
VRHCHVATLLALLLCSCGPALPEREQVQILFSLPPAVPSPPAAATEAGARLFARLCNSCHDLGKHGQDGGAARTARNTPTIVDSSRKVVQGWDGRGSGFEAMCVLELEARKGITDDASLRTALAGTDVLAQLEASPGPLLSRATAALHAFLRTLTSYGRWDRYLDGDETALSSAEQRGLAEFLDAGCAACHAGRLLGGTSWQKLGSARPYATTDPGRMAVTGREADRAFFKVPALRLCVHTGPWLHDGSVGELGEMVRLMARHETGRELRDDQVTAITAFLRAMGDVAPVSR